jgi:hypothetical protein
MSTPQLRPELGGSPALVRTRRERSTACHSASI